MDRHWIEISRTDTITIGWKGSTGKSMEFTLNPVSFLCSFVSQALETLTTCTGRLGLLCSCPKLNSGFNLDTFSFHIRSLLIAFTFYPGARWAVKRSHVFLKHLPVESSRDSASGRCNPTEQSNCVYSATTPLPLQILAISWQLLREPCFGPLLQWNRAVPTTHCSSALPALSENGGEQEISIVRNVDTMNTPHSPLHHTTPHPVSLNVAMKSASLPCYDKYRIV